MAASSYWQHCYAPTSTELYLIIRPQRDNVVHKKMLLLSTEMVAELIAVSHIEKSGHLHIYYNS